MMNRSEIAGSKGYGILADISKCEVSNVKKIMIRVKKAVFIISVL